MDQDLDFEIGNGNKIYGGCAAMLMGQMMYFGGSGSKRQVKNSKENKLDLTNILLVY